MKYRKVRSNLRFSEHCFFFCDFYSFLRFLIIGIALHISENLSHLWHGAKNTYSLFTEVNKSKKRVLGV